MVKRCAEHPITTFSIRFDEADYDEGPFQDEVVRHLELGEHHSTRCSVADIGRVFPDVIWHCEQPILRTGPAPMYLLAKLVRERGYKVVLTGEGSDELLGGYDIFKEAKIRRFCARQPGSRMRPLLLQRLYPYLTRLQNQSPQYVQAFFEKGDLDSPWFSHLPRWQLTARIKQFFSEDVRKQLGARDPHAAIPLPARFRSWEPFCQAQYLETAHLLPGYILASQGDRMAMAHGVEGRFPFLDVRVAELAARLPVSLKMKALDEKYLLKRAAADLVPPRLLKRKKQPYRAPDVTAFFDPERGAARFDYVEELLSPAAIARVGLFDPGAVSRLVAKATCGAVIGVKDGMALTGILSTQLTVEQLIHEGGKASP
jgi:asparagine synthase (glutamine-hydrolysing)